MKDAITIIRGLIDAGVPAEHAITAAEFIASAAQSVGVGAEAVTDNSVETELAAMTRRVAHVHGVTAQSMRKRHTTHAASRARAACILEAKSLGISTAAIADYYNTSKGSVHVVVSKARSAARAETAAA